MSLSWRTCGRYAFLAAAVVTATLRMADAADSADQNLLANGGMEQWQTDKLPTPGPNVPAIPNGVPVGWSVLQEAYERGDEPGFPIRGTVSRDAATTAGGEASLHITNALTTDITEVSQGPLAAQPNAVYRVRCRVRGEKIAPNSQDGCGAIVWANTGTGAPGDTRSGYQPLARTPAACTGSFDWQVFEFFAETGPEATWMRVALQLRRASGEAWFDEVEVACVAKVHPVDSY